MAEPVIIQAPDGKRYKVQIPQGKTEEDARLWFKGEFQAGRVTPEMAIAQTPTKQDKASWWEEFKAGFGRADTDVANLSVWLESRFPLGQISAEGYQSPEETYGKEFMQMSPDQRRQFLFNNREAQEEAEFGEKGKEGISAFLGNVTGSLMSPSTLAPVGNSLKAAAGIGAGLGLGFSAAEDLAETGEVDPVKAAMFGGMGAVAAPATLFTGRALGKLFTGPAKPKAKPVEKIEEVALKDVAESVAPELETKGIVNTAEDIEKQNFFAPKEPAKVPQDSSGAPRPDVKERGVISKTIDDFLGNISTRVKDLSPTVFGKLRKFEFDTHVHGYDTKLKVEPFIKSLRGLDKEASTNLTRYLYNGEVDKARDLMAREAPGMEKEYDVVQEVLSDLYMDLKDAGYDHLGFIENYYPRYVKDVPGLLESLGKKEKSIVEVALDKKAKALGKGDRANLTPDEEAQVVNSVLRGFAPKETGGRLGFTKSRSIEKLGDSQLQYYSSLGESLDSYIGRAINDIEKRKFFGKGAAVKDGRINISESIGNLVAEERRAGNLSDAQIVELSDLLQARFGGGERAPGKFTGTLRDLTNMSTIANPVSAATQLGDVGVATYMNGMRNTFAAMFGKKVLDMKELGLLQELAEELTSKQSTAKALHKMFSWSGFRKMDRFGKNTLINGSHRKWTALAKTPKGQMRLRNKYGEVFGDSYDGLVSDLQTGRMSENVKFMLWNELSDAQPISLSEVPKKYLEAPNGRIFYALKTFMIKQMDILRRDIIQQYKKGNKAEAIKNAGLYTVLVGGSNTAINEVKDLMLGGELNPESLASDKIVLNALKNFGGSEYAWNRSLKQGKPFEFISNQALPALGWIDALGQDVINLADPEKEASLNTLRAAPIVGKLMYYWFTEEGQEKMLQKELDDAGLGDE